MAKDAGIKEEKISKLILGVYQLLGSEQVIKSIEDKLRSFKTNGLKKAINDGKFKTFLVIEPFVNLKPEKIKSAAELLGIQLEEKVYIPDEDQWTDTEVPVGVSYYNFLEHYSDVYSAVRGSEKYVGLTGQPTKRKANFGGQALGNLDTFALITHDVPHIVDELYGARSDDHKSKKFLYNGIIQSGNVMPTPQKEVTGGTKYIFDLYMLGIGLEVR